MLPTNVYVATIWSVDLPPEELISNAQANGDIIKNYFLLGTVKNNVDELTQEQKKYFFLLSTW